MLLRLIRNTKLNGTKQTRGNLYAIRNGEHLLLADTIEPPETPNDTHPKGCIPKGWYKVEVTFSPRFKRRLPLLRIVPGFEGIRIHAGLSVKNTTGCICIGRRETEDKITELLTKTQNNHEENYIHILDYRDYCDSGTADPDTQQPAG